MGCKSSTTEPIVIDNKKEDKFVKLDPIIDKTDQQANHDKIAQTEHE